MRISNTLLIAPAALLSSHSHCSGRVSSHDYAHFLTLTLTYKVRTLHSHKARILNVSSCQFERINFIPKNSYSIYLGLLEPDFGKMFLKLKYTDLTKNTYIRSWTVTEIMAREKCSLLAVPRTVPGSRDVLPVHCTCPSFSLQPAQAHSRCDCTCTVPWTLRTTTT